MHELVIDFISSLDGYAAAEGWPGWWGLEGPEYLAWLDDHPGRDHAVLMDANTYRVMSEIAAANADAPIFVAMAEMPKVVFSCTLTTPLTWANTRLVGSDTIEAVREMKRSGIQLLEYVPRILTAPPGGAT
jgi:dihydrofolate reductase